MVAGIAGRDGREKNYFGGGDVGVKRHFDGSEE